MPSKYIRDTTIHFSDNGHGPAIVLVHGFPHDSHVWDQQASDLSKHYRVIAPDLPGFGRSEPATAFTIESAAEDLHTLLRSIDALPCVLAGLSMGGYIALAYAEKFPSDLRGLVLVDTRSQSDTADGRKSRDEIITLVRDNGSKAVAEQMLSKTLSADTRHDRPEIVRRLTDMMTACPPTAIENALVAMRDRPDYTKMLPSIRTPTLVIVGETDAITPTDVAEKMYRAIPDSALRVIPGSGHLSPIEQPALVNQAFRNFMQELRPLQTVGGGSE